MRWRRPTRPGCGGTTSASGRSASTRCPRCSETAAPNAFGASRSCRGCSPTCTGSWWPHDRRKGRMPMTSDVYLANGNEVQLFERAYRRRIPVMLTGLTGCGKTRLVEHMGMLLGRPVVTISCHDDLTSSDLVGRFMVACGDV